LPRLKLALAKAGVLKPIRNDGLFCCVRPAGRTHLEVKVLHGP